MDLAQKGGAAVTGRDHADAPTAARLEGELIARLESVIDRARWASRAERVGVRLAPLPLFFGAVVGLDAVAELPPWALASAAGLLGFLALRSLAGLLPAWGARRASRAWAARRVERTLGRDDNPIITALQLCRVAMPPVDLQGAAPGGSVQRAGADEVTRGLAQRALARGVAAASEAPASRVVSLRRAVRAWARAGVSLGAMLVVAVLEPRLIVFGAARLADPFGGRAPFTRTDFRVSMSPGEPLVGDDVAVTVEASGEQPDALDLVLFSGAGEESVRLPMRTTPGPEGARVFTATLRSVQAPLTFHAAGPTGRTDGHEVNPARRPRLRSGTLTIEPPAYTSWPSVTARLNAEGAVDGPVRAIVGSGAELRVVTSLPLAGAGAGADRDTEGARARAGFMLDAPGERTLRLAPVSDAGLAMTPEGRVTIAVFADAPPSAAFALPAQGGQRVALLAGAAAPVRVEARDDVALAACGVEWTATANDGTPIGAGELPLVRDDAGSTAQRDLVGLVDSAALGLRTGDRVLLRAVSMDNRPSAFGGPQRTASEVVEVVIVDQEGIERARGTAREGEAVDTGAGGSAEASGSPDVDTSEGGAGSTPGDRAGEQWGAPPDVGGARGQPSAGAGPGTADRGFARVYDGASDVEAETASSPAGAGATSSAPEGHGAGSLADTGASGQGVKAPGRSGASGDATFAPLSGSLSDAPAGYREAAARYFRRIAEQDAQRWRERSGP